MSNPDEFASLDAAVLDRELARFDADPSAGAGALVHRLRSAMRVGPPQTMAERQAEYGREVVVWLEANMPECCTVNPKVVEATRAVYGDVEADRLAASTGPHPAAVAAVFRSHHANGRQSVKVSVVRAAVKASDARALEDLKAIAKKSPSAVVGSRP